MSAEAPVDRRVTLEAARDAVAELTPALTSLLRGLPDPAVPAVGTWTAGDVAAHVVHVAEVDVAAAHGRVAEAFEARGVSLPRAIKEVSPMNAAVLEADPERNPAVNATRIEHAVGELLGTCRDEGADETTVPWLLGATLTRAAVCSHLVSELLLHGYDVARGAGLEWTIRPELARLAIEGFYLAVIPAGDSANRPHQRRPPACEVRLRGGGSFVLSTTDAGPVVGATTERVYLPNAADTATKLVSMSGRGDRLRAVVTGRMVAWGRHPIRGARMLDTLRAP